MLVDFALHNPLDDPSTTVKIRACTVPSTSDEDKGEDDSSHNLRRHNDYENDNSPFSKRAAANTTLCIDTASSINVSLNVSMVGDGSNLTWVTADALAMASSYMSASCDLKQTFSYGQGAIVGIYSGEAIDNGGTVSPILAAAIAIANNSDTGSPESFYVQRCVNDPIGNSTSAQNIFGVAVNNAGNLGWVQTAVQSWSKGNCLNASSFTTTTGVNSSTVAGITIWEYSHPAVVLSNLTDPGSNSSSSSSTSASATTATRSGVSLSTTTSLATSKTVTSVAITKTAPATTSQPPTQSTGSYATPPGPTQTGIPHTCDGYSIPATGQGCYDFAAAHGITLADFCGFFSFPPFPSQYSIC
jgi:chitinase